MNRLTQIRKVAIGVFLITMVAVLNSTLSGCRSCTSPEDEITPWIPVARDTIPEEVVADTLELPPLLEDEDGEEEPITIVPSANKAKKVTQPSYSRSGSTKQRENNHPYVHYYSDGEGEGLRTWTDEFDLDSIVLTITTSDLEMEITQNQNDDYGY